MRYIASCSFGKDSIATILLAHIYNEPLDEIVFSEVMFDENTSGENPLHKDFIYNIAIPKFKAMGYKTKILRSEKMNYIKSFYSIVKYSKTKERNGKMRGFLLPFGCAMNSACKVQPIRNYYKTITEPIMQYIGIAIDEPIRLARLNGNRISLLAKYNYTEAMAKELCKEYGLLSPIYNFSNRGGCWFCPNAKDEELIFIKINYPELWQKLEKLPTNNIALNKFNRKESFEQLNERLNEIIKIKENQMRLF